MLVLLVRQVLLLLLLLLAEVLSRGWATIITPGFAS